MSKTTNNQKNFGKSIAELEEIVAWFESGDVDLDKALERFERGMELVENLKKHLREVENKVEVIKNKFNTERSGIKPENTGADGEFQAVSEPKTESNLESSDEEQDTPPSLL